MNKVNYLPLGSIVQLEGGTQRLMIIARGLTMERAGRMFPQGLTGDQLAYFNHDAIRSLSFIGCNDGDSQTVVNALHQYVEQHPELERCTPREWESLA